MADTVDLRDWQPKESQAKCVMDTKSLDTMARETADTVTDTNENKERVVNHPNFGPLGATGRH